MKPIIKRFAVVSSVTAASIGSLFIQTLTNAGSLPNSENGFSSDSTIKTVYTETVAAPEETAKDIFDNKAIAITGLDVYASADKDAAVVGKLDDKNIADVIANEGDMTLVQSGNLKGYVKSENLVIGDEAEAVAYNIGNVTAKSKADNTVLYGKDNKETVKTVNPDETLKVVSTAENKLVVQLDNNVEAYVNTDQVDVDFGLETGKTNEEIAAEEAAKKAAEEAERAEAERAKAAKEAEAKAAEEAEAEEEAASYSGSSVSGPYSSHLTKSAGVFNGPSGYETYYNLNMNGVVRIMRSLGYSEADGWVYWVRDDGVKMFGNYVMVAADLSRRPKGTILESSLGTAIVVDTGSFVASNPNQLDIAVAW